MAVLFHDSASTELYPLSLHDALPISATPGEVLFMANCARCHTRGWSYFDPTAPQSNPAPGPMGGGAYGDRKSTRLNSSHPSISYAVFCLKKKLYRASSPRHNRAATAL